MVSGSFGTVSQRSWLSCSKSTYYSDRGRANRLIPTDRPDPHYPARRACAREKPILFQHLMPWPRQWITKLASRLLSFRVGAQRRTKQGRKKMRNLLKTATVAVLAVALTVGPSTLMAAPTHGARMATERSDGPGLFQTFLWLLGFTPLDSDGSLSRSPKSGNDGAPSLPGPSTPSGIGSQPSRGVTPDGAIWGRCDSRPC